MQVVYTSRGLEVNLFLIKSELREKYALMLERLTIRHCVKLNKMETNHVARGYRIFGSTLVLPRRSIHILKFFCPKLRGFIKMPTGQKAVMVSSLVMPENQEKMVNHILNKVLTSQLAARGSATCVFVADPGTGKSYMGAEIAARLGLKTLVICPSSTAISEWKISCSFLNAQIGEYHSKAKRDGDIVITTIKSALHDVFVFGKKNLSSCEFLSQFGLIIYDEIHCYTSECAQEIFWRCNSQYVLGLTGTPADNPHGFDQLYQWHLGDLVVGSALPDIHLEYIPWTGDIQVIRYTGPAEYTARIESAIGFVDHGKMVRQFNSDPYRTAMAISALETDHKSGRNAFVFVKFRDTAEFLVESLQHLSGVCILYGGATEENIASAKLSRIIVATYSYAWQSLSIPRMDTIYFYDPRVAKMEQLLGRILRLSSDSSIPRKIVDIVDEMSPMAVNEFQKRRIIYKKKVIRDGAEVRKYPFTILPPVYIHYSNVLIS